MSILVVENLNHSFGDRIIFKNSSLFLNKGEHVGLVGANGEGKSTFMNIIIGNLLPDSGKIEWSKKAQIGYLDQHIQLKKGQTIKTVLRMSFKEQLELEKQVSACYNQMAVASPEELETLLEYSGVLQERLERSGFYQIDGKIEEVAGGLGLNEVGLDSYVENLSGGQRTKVLLAKLLLERPGILLLDEPTNFLDEEHIEWLGKYLKSYEQAFILISHDSEFLNDVVSVIYHVHNQTLTRYSGNYHFFVKNFTLKNEQVLNAYERQRDEIDRLEKFVAKNKARASTKGRAMSRQKQLDKMERITITKENPKPRFHFQKAVASSKILFETNKFVIGYNKPLSKPLDLVLERGEKIAMVGANGIGKTTLLRSILGEIKPIAGDIKYGQNLFDGYFVQEIKVPIKKTCLEVVWDAFPYFTQEEVRRKLAQCGLTTKHIESPVSSLSGGEQSKVRLCLLLNKETNWLLLDEPTNHLDKDAKKSLQEALQDYKGSLLLISHEPSFYKEIVHSTWNCEKWSLNVPAL